MKKMKLSERFSATFLVLAVCFMVLFLSQNTMAAEFDNVKSYNEELKVVTITNAFGLGDVIGQAKLNTPQKVLVGLGYQKVAEFDIWAYQDYNDAIKQFTFTDMKTKNKVNREFDMKALSYEDIIVDDYIVECFDDPLIECNKIPNGSHVEQRQVWTKLTPADLMKDEVVTVGIFTDVKDGDHVDWIPVIYGVEIDEWAEWEASLEAGLVSYYPLNDDDLTDYLSLNDLTNNGTIDGDGIIGTGRNLSGVNDLNAGTMTGFSENMEDDTSYSVWFKGTDTTQQNIMGLDDGNTMLFRLSLNEPTTGKVYLIMRDLLSNRIYGSTTSAFANMNDGEWHNLVMTIDGDAGSSAINIYIDNVSYAFSYSDQDVFSNFNTFTNDFLIGAHGTTSVPQSPFTGSIDEVGFWNRTLTVTEVSNLWNDGAGISPISGVTNAVPQISLTSPANNSNLTSSSQDFIATITDDKKVQNVSLKIDGAIVSTDTSNANGSYTFSETITEGYHNWSILAYDNESASNESGVWFFNYTQPPIYIDLQSPTDSSLHQVPSVNMSCNAYKEEGVLQLNLTVFGETLITLSNSTPGENLSISQDVNFSEGNYTWGCSAMNTETSATSTNRTFEVSYSNPVLNLILPTDNQNLTTGNINFTFNVTDLNGVANVSLYVDGALSETNTSGLEGDYSFNKVIADGTHNWSVIAVSTYSKSATSATRTFSIDTSDPAISLFAPPSTFDYLIADTDVFLNWSVSDDNLDSCWHDYYSTSESFSSIDSTLDDWFDDDITNPTGMKTGNFSVNDGANELVFTRYATGGGCSPNPKIEYDYINITPCSSANGVVKVIANTSSDADFNYQHLYCDGALLLNESYAKITTCGPGTSEIFINKTLVNCNANTTTFSYIENRNNITFYANDTYGGMGSSLASWSVILTEGDWLYSNVSLEGSVDDWQLNITTDSSVSPNSVYLVYNGTPILGSINEYATSQYTLTAQSVALATTGETNYTAYFSITLNDSTVANTSSKTQLVTNLGIDNCDTYNNTLFNFTLYDEKTQALINGTAKNTVGEVNVQLYDTSDESLIVSFNDEYNDTNPFAICLDNNLTATDEYVISLELSYTADDYSKEFYYIIGEPLDSGDINTQISLYLLDNSTAQAFKIIYKDENFLPVSGVLQLQRKYLSEGVFKTVEQPRIDSAGEAIMQVELEDAVYTVNIIIDGEIDAIFSNIRFYCPNPLIEDCEEVLNKFESYSDVTDFSTVNGLSFSFDYNDTTRVISSPFSVLSGSSKNVEMRVSLYDAFGNQSICSDSLVSSSGTLSCSIPNSFGNSSVIAEIYDGGVMAGKSVVRLDGLGQDNYGVSLMVIGVISLLLLIMIGLTPGEPILYGIFLIIGVIFLTVLNVIFSTSWIGAGSTFLWFIIAVILIIVKGANR